MRLEQQYDVVYELAERAANKFEDWDSLGNIYARYDSERYPQIVLLNYTGAAGRKGEWNEAEQVCRGLMLRWGHHTPKVVAWPFEKFFNIGEHGRKPRGHIELVTKKFDGSLGIMYRDTYNNPKIATRGSFNSDYAIWATDFLERWYLREIHDNLPVEATYLFEIIAPHLRNVIDYGNRPRLVLLAARYNHNGEYIPYYPNLYMYAQRANMELAPPVSFHSLTDIIEASGTLPGTEEGWVIEMSNGERWKVKGDDYVELHRIVHQISLKRALEYVIDNTTIDILDSDLLPEEHLARWDFYVDMLVDSFHNILSEAWRLFVKESPSGDSRREFAKWATSEERRFYSPLLFAYLDRESEDRKDKIVGKLMKKLYTDGKYDWIEDAYKEKVHND